MAQMESTLGRHHREGDDLSGEGHRDSLGGEAGGLRLPGVADGLSPLTLSLSLYSQDELSCGDAHPLSCRELSWTDLTIHRCRRHLM